MKMLLVVGATGYVGQGIVASASSLGWSVIAAGRNADKLSRFESDGKNVATVIGDVASEAGADALWNAATACFGGIDAAVVAVNAPNDLRPLLEWTPAELLGVFDGNLMTHFVAAKTFLPRLPADGMFLGIGGGTADFIMPNMAQVSMTQARSEEPTSELQSLM